MTDSRQLSEIRRDKVIRQEGAECPRDHMGGQKRPEGYRANDWGFVGELELFRRRMGKNILGKGNKLGKCVSGQI
jgi:hypothetical protein